MEGEVSINFLNRLWGRKTSAHSDLVELFRPQYDEIGRLFRRDILCIAVKVGSNSSRYRNIEGITVNPKDHTFSFEFRHRGRLQVATYNLEPSKTDIIFLTTPQRQTAA